ncbi:hypothetical protein [Dechloromonas sp. A34]|uniref:hypothetical protein n=1 Tax=Dechloromonas sp. A34 TaxID=447588 RepID=UPI0022488E9D|nr:hypothetical protein [Dechloromonas sp. A34]
MAIQSVTSNVNAFTNPGTQPTQTQQSQQTQQAQAIEKQEPRPAERVELKEEAPKPVTNAQGQRTGTLINVTA